MNPGDIRTFKKGSGKAVVLAVGVWAEREKQDGPIQIHLTGTPNFHTTVNNNASSQRYHRTLFRNLRRLLIEQKSWPYGTAGEETEEDG